MRLFHLFSLLFFLVACTAKDTGFITLVNSDIETIKVSIDGRIFTIYPSNHITKEVGLGPHEIRINAGEPIRANVFKDKTTVFDSTGLSCFVVADFSGRYHNAEVQIVERFERKQVFSTADKMFTVLGSYLPKNIPANERILRIHQIDCEIINDDATLKNELLNMP